MGARHHRRVRQCGSSASPWESWCGLQATANPAHWGWMGHERPSITGTASGGSSGANGPTIAGAFAGGSSTRHLKPQLPQYSF